MPGAWPRWPPSPSRRDGLRLLLRRPGVARLGACLRGLGSVLLCTGKGRGLTQRYTVAGHLVLEELSGRAWPVVGGQLGKIRLMTRVHGRVVTCRPGRKRARQWLLVLYSLPGALAQLLSGFHRRVGTLLVQRDTAAQFGGRTRPIVRRLSKIRAPLRVHCGVIPLRTGPRGFCFPRRPRWVFSAKVTLRRVVVGPRGGGARKARLCPVRRRFKAARRLTTGARISVGRGTTHRATRAPMGCSPIAKLAAW